MSFLSQSREISKGVWQPFDMPPDLLIALTPVHFEKCVKNGSSSYPHADLN